VSCVSAVEDLERLKSPVVVCCYGETLEEKGGKINKIVCAQHKKVYVFHMNKNSLELLQKGRLEKFLISREITKVILS